MPYQMVAQRPIPMSAKPGRVARYDYEYERTEMLNIFALFEPKRGWRHLDVTERRTAVDLAQAMRRLADEHYPDAEKVPIVLDNLNTHTPASLYKAFEPEKARRLLGSVGVSSHTQTRLLAQAGGDRTLGALAAGPESPHPGREYAKEAEWDMGERAKRTRGDG
jgi:hypothetical protein